MSEGDTERPDHTRWFTYPTYLDRAVKSPDFAVFLKMNLFELGAYIRQLKQEILASPLDAPALGTEFNAEHFIYHVTLLSFVSSWIEALGFSLLGKAGFGAAFTALSSFCQNGVH